MAKVVACDASGRGWGIDQFYIILQSFNKHYERAIIHLSINKHTWFKCMVTRRWNKDIDLIPQQNTCRLFLANTTPRQINPYLHRPAFHTFTWGISSAFLTPLVHTFTLKLRNDDPPSECAQIFGHTLCPWTSYISTWKIARSRT